MSRGTIGYKGMKPGNCGTVYMPYIPVQLTPEQIEAMRKKEVAGKTFAKVSERHPDRRFSGKTGEVLDVKVEDGATKYLVRLNIYGNNSPNSRCWTAIKPAYVNEWIGEEFIDHVWSYDDSGNEVKADCPDKPR